MTEEQRDHLNAKQRELYAKLRSKGICVRCKKAKARPGKAQCEACAAATAVDGAARSKRRYVWLREHGFCTLCGHEKALEGMSVCTVCRERSNAYAAKSRGKATPKRKEYRKQYDRELREWYSEHGLCTKCGREHAEPGLKTCKKCLDAYRRRYARDTPAGAEIRQKERDRRAQREAEGLCKECGKRPPEEGRKMCRRCLNMRAEVARVARIRKRLKEGRA